MMNLVGSSTDLPYPMPEGVELKALYEAGSDNRENLCALERIALDPPIVDSLIFQSKSVACLMDKEFLEKLPAGSYRLKPLKLSQRLAGIYGVEHQFIEPNLRFKDEPAPGRGTGFYVGNGLIVTAAHCVCKRVTGFPTNELDPSKIKKTRVVFDFKMNDKNTCQQDFSRVYKIKHVVAWEGIKADWAIVRLTEDVIGSDPLVIEDGKLSQVKKNDEIYMLGHPTGLPLKYTHKGKIKDISKREFFSAQLDAFAGNSGSPVFNAVTRKVVGILVDGRKDYSFDDTKLLSTHVVTQIEIDDYGYEGCQRISSIAKLIYAIRVNSGDLEILLHNVLHYEKKPRPLIEIDYPEETPSTDSQELTSVSVPGVAIELAVRASVRVSKKVSDRVSPEGSLTTLSSCISRWFS